MENSQQPTVAVEMVAPPPILSPSIETTTSDSEKLKDSGSSAHSIHFTAQSGRQVRDKDTMNPIPHSVFPHMPFPKTGGRLGNLYLLWGDERKHSFFPFVAIAGPDWPSMLFTYVGFILLTCLDCFIIKGSTENMSMVRLVIIVAAVLFYILLTTTLSNPGIAFRDQPVDPSVQTVSTCRICEIQRMPGTCHCERCGVCYVQLDHHCPWMGKCIARNNLVLFYISVASFFILCIGASGII
ncbi:hypothetical protein WA588_000489, partial [Blastocystis sp. NMH]